MKKHLKKNAFRLNDDEKEAVWFDVSRPLAGDRRQVPRWRPLLASTAVVAASLALVIVLTNDPSDRQRFVQEVVIPDVTVSTVGEKAADVSKSDTGSESVEIAADNRSVATPVKPAGTLEHQPAGTPQVASARTRQELSEGALLGFNVYDAETGEYLPYAAVTVSSEVDSVLAHIAGRSEPMAIEPGTRQTVQVSHLGYASQETTVILEPGQNLELALAMPPETVETLEAFEVEAAKMMIETRSTGSAAKPQSEKREYRVLDSIGETVARQAGPARREGELYVRGGRSSEIPPGSSGTPVDDPLGGTGKKRAVFGAPAESGGTDNPNDRPYDLTYHEHYGVNPFVATEEDALSTFAIDVDNASYTIARRYLRDGNLPDKDAVRVEEFINYFDQGYPEVAAGDFAIRADGAPSPFGAGKHLLRVGLQGRDVATADRKPANLVFVVDVSGSMNRENRLQLVKKALRILLDELEPSDSVGLVVYGSRGEVIIEPTSIEERGRLEKAIERLQPGGSTNAEEGLNLAYDMARRHYQRSAINRLILCSDGVANVGRTGADSILEHIRRESDAGITLSTIGFGMGNYNDVLMEKLADQGDGNYYYVDELAEAERVFRENLTATLQTIARDTKIQIEFDPEHVVRYRLLGYENRDVADRDFRNDAVDAGEVGAGHQVTALYELKLSDAAIRALDEEQTAAAAKIRLATARLRYEVPPGAAEAGLVKEIATPIFLREFTNQFAQAAPRLQLTALVAEFAEILRRSYWAKDSRLSQLVPMAQHLAETLADDADVVELEKLISRAAGLVKER